MPIPIKATRCPHCTSRTGGRSRLARRFLFVAERKTRPGVQSQIRLASSAATDSAGPGRKSRHDPATAIAERMPGIFNRKPAPSREDGGGMMMADNPDPHPSLPARNGHDGNRNRCLPRVASRSGRAIGDRDFRRATITSQRVAGAQQLARFGAAVGRAPDRPRR